MPTEEIKKLIHELHRPALPIKVYRQVRVPHKDDTWALDLMVMPKPELNDDYRYVFLCEDVFTRYIWYAKLKTKTKADLWNAMTDIFEQAGTQPNKLWGDQEGGWYSTYWKTRLEARNIILYSTYADFGVSVIESAVKTLKHFAQPVYEERGSLRWIDVLPEVIAYYNKEHIHSKIKMTPAAARVADEAELYKIQYGAPRPRKQPIVFKIGDWVRVARQKDIFEKGYEARWSYQPFEIIAIDAGEPPLYYVREGNGNNIAGAFYAQELQKTSVRDAVLIQDIITRTNTRSKVRFRGFPKGYEQWILNTQIDDLLA